MSQDLASSPFLVNKACLKYPLRSVTGYGYVESRHKTSLMKSMRKTDSYNNYFEEPERYHKDKALEYLRRRRNVIESHGSKARKPRKRFEAEKDLDLLSQRIIEEEENSKKLDLIYAESKNPEVKNQPSKAKGYHGSNKDSKLRSAIHSTLTDEKVKLLFDNYKKFYFSQKMRHLEDDERNQLEKFIEIKENEIKDFEDFFVVHALKMGNMDVKNLLKVPETKAKDLVKLTSPNEPMREIEEIVKKGLAVLKDDPMREYEEKYWIDVFQTVDLAITNFKFQKPELRYKRMNNFLQLIARPYLIYKEAEHDFKKQQSKLFVKVDRHNRDFLKSEQSQRTSLSTSLRTSKEWRTLKTDLQNHQIPQSLSPTRPESRASSDPLSFFITNPRGLPEEVPKVIKVSSLINSHNADQYKIPGSARTILEESAETRFPESPKIFSQPDRRAQTAARDRTRNTEMVEPPTARTSLHTPFVFERTIYERGKSAESIWKNSMLLSERPQFQGSKAIQQDFRDFYDKYGDLMKDSVNDTRKFLSSLDEQKDMLDQDINKKMEVTLDTVLANTPDPDTQVFKSCLQLKKRVVTKLLESVENKDEVLVALQKRNSTNMLKNTMGRSFIKKLSNVKKL